MIQLHKGNLFYDDAEVLVNTINCVGVMGKGIALQFKELYPDMFECYKQACKKGEVVVGRMFVYPITQLIPTNNVKYIFNFPTKDHWRDPSEMEYISKGLIHLAYCLGKYDIKSIAIPALGCNNGGLKWSKVRTEIVNSLCRLNEVDIRLYIPKRSN